MAAKRVFKYPFRISSSFDVYELELPEGAEILNVDMRGFDCCLWVLVRPQAAMEKRYFRVFGTGQPIQDDGSLRYIGTVKDPVNDGAHLTRHGHYIWHVFESEEECTCRRHPGALCPTHHKGQR